MRDLGDRTEDSTIDFGFHTTNLSAVPTTLSGTPAISVYKANGTTQSTAGVTLTADFDTVTGLNQVRIDLSADAFYATGNDYFIVITTGTVDSISVVGSVVATFSIENRFAEVDVTAISGDTTAADNLELMYDGTGYTDDTAPASRAQVGAIGSGSAGAVNYAPTEDNTSGAIIGGITKVGTPTGTYANTEAEDGSLHSIADVGNDIDWVYGYDIGGNNQATEFALVANVNGNADEIKVKVYDHVGAGWDIIGTIDGSGGTAFQTLNLSLLSKHTGTGSELGKVYIRFDTDSTTPELLEIDKALVTAVNVSQSVGYELGRVWINTSTGTSGTEAYVNGVADNPCTTIAEAVAIAASVGGLRDFHVSSDSSITLAADLNDYNVYGIGYGLDFAGYDCAGTHFYHASPVSGICTSVNNSDHLDILDSIVGNVTVDDSHFTNCSFTGTVTLGSVGSTVRFIGCRSMIAGSSTPILDFGTASANHNVTIADWQNGIEIRNFNATTGGGTDLLSISGTGQIVIASTCDGGTINLRGQWAITDNSGGAVTIVKDDVATDAEAAAALLTTQMTESYASDGTAPTLAQMQFMVYSALAQFSITTDTITTHQLDGTTAAMTFTMDDASNPTSRTRAT